MRSWRRVAQGVVFIGVLLGVIGFTVASFQQRFTDSVPVLLKVERAGTQLEKNADVKLRGLIIGRVAKQTTGGDGVTLELALQPDKAKLVPEDVRARLLPKTLFGEKYVDLVVPPGTTVTDPIDAGDVIGEDRSEAALEVERVLADLFPLLRGLEPEKLNRALTAIADSLRGQGDTIGASLERLDAYLARLEPELPDIQENFSGLADLASSMNTNADDLLRLARNSVVGAKTLTGKQDVLTEFLRGSAGFVDTTTKILNRDGDNLVALSDTSRPILEVVHGRRGILVPTVQGLQHMLVELNDALDDGNALNIRLEVVPNRGFYTSPCRYPNCNDGSGDSAGTPMKAGSEAERETLRKLLAPVLEMTPDTVPDVVDVLFGPVLRNAMVRAAAA